jgi:DNA-binding transcriptional LysR family regulator
MDLRQMRYFLAVARERNFGRAAKALHMAQPPLTRQIKAMEEDLGVELFLRTSRGVELTDAAQALVVEAENLLALAQRAEHRVRLAGQGLAGHLEIGVFGSGILNVVPRIMAAFHKQRPEVTIGLRNLSKNEQIQALRERRLDVGFARLIPGDEDLGIEIVRREPVLVALYDGHPLCSQKEITVRDLDNEPMILYPTFAMTGLAQRVADAFRRGRAKLRVEQEVEDAVTAIALVSSGFGLCVTTDSAASLRLPGVTYRPLRSAHLRDIEMSCFYRKDDSSPLLQAFLLAVRAYERSVSRST